MGNITKAKGFINKNGERVLMIPASHSHTTSEIEGLQDVLNSKIDKVTNVTSGNFCSLDANGNLIDSKKNANSFASVIHGHSNLSNSIKEIQYLIGTEWKILEESYPFSGTNTSHPTNCYGGKDTDGIVLPKNSYDLINIGDSIKMIPKPTGTTIGDSINMIPKPTGTTIECTVTRKGSDPYYIMTNKNTKVISGIFDFYLKKQGKADLLHTHNIEDIDGLSTELNSKLAIETCEDDISSDFKNSDILKTIITQGIHPIWYIPASGFEKHYFLLVEYSKAKVSPRYPVYKYWVIQCLIDPSGMILRKRAFDDEEHTIPFDEWTEWDSVIPYKTGLIEEENLNVPTSHAVYEALTEKVGKDIINHTIPSSGDDNKLPNIGAVRDALNKCVKKDDTSIKVKHYTGTSEGRAINLSTEFSYINGNVARFLVHNAKGSDDMYGNLFTATTGTVSYGTSAGGGTTIGNGDSVLFTVYKTIVVLPPVQEGGESTQITYYLVKAEDEFHVTYEN